MKITEIADLKIKCTGCSACAAGCGEKAISMVRDEEGFLFPSLAEEACINCGKCAELCRAASAEEYFDDSISEIYAFQSAEKELLMDSTSGGLFPTLAKIVIDRGGVAFGAAYGENMEVFHKSALQAGDIKEFHGSKYVQSNLKEVFREVKEFLEGGREVLFSGTPCQIRGLKAFLGKAYEKLITVDVICYGVPSQMLFDKYIELVQAEEKARVVDFSFRDKHKYGWSHTVVATFEKENGRRFKKILGNEYNNLWYRAWKYCDCLRESCYNCRLVSEKRASDFTIGNFWGIDEISNAFKTENGVSLLAVNNKSKKDICLSLEKYGVLEAEDDSMLKKYQHGLSENKKRTDKRSNFYKSLDKGYLNMISYLYPIGLKDKIMMNVPIRLQKTVIGLAKKLGGLK